MDRGRGAALGAAGDHHHAPRRRREGDEHRGDVARTDRRDVERHLDAVRAGGREGQAQRPRSAPGRGARRQAVDGGPLRHEGGLPVLPQREHAPRLRIDVDREAPGRPLGRISVETGREDAHAPRRPPPRSPGEHPEERLG
ncbi:MAG: hypothetical protein ACK56I_04740, partial [bacterium]